jgi:hypothetical protein
MIVAIHQPNYLPWLGYFFKIAQSDAFVLLDDVQYSKNSYTNRVKIMREGAARWLTQPVSFRFGDPINIVTFARDDWKKAHLDSLEGAYRRAPEFTSVWPEIAALYGGLNEENISAANAKIIMGICEHLNISCRFHLSSEIEVHDARSEDRLIEIVDQIAPGGCYLSGRGGAQYQDPGKFSAAGLELKYANFQHSTYEQGTSSFIAGLSVFDAVFHLGWQRTAQLLRT